MKIPKFFHPVLGVMTGTVLFLAGIAAVSAVFVLAYKAIQYAKPFLAEVWDNFICCLSHCLPL